MDNLKLIEILCNADAYVSGEEISAKLGISRTAVWKRISLLREEGYLISSRTKLGYRLDALPDKLSRERIIKASGLAEDSVTLYCRETVGSTNNEIKSYADSTSPSGLTVLLSEQQSSGRGRMGRGFYSPSAEGLYMSILFKPESVESISGLTCMCAITVCRAIERLCSISAGIKWTNDIVAGGKKLCGILTELSSEGESGALSYVVIGIGINVNQEAFPSDLEQIAASLFMLSGERQERNLLAGYLLAGLYEMRKGLGTNRNEYMEEYRGRCVNLGRTVEFRQNGELRRADAYGIADDGALLVRYPGGEYGSLSFGEVSIIDV